MQMIIFFVDRSQAKSDTIMIAKIETTTNCSEVYVLTIEYRNAPFVLPRRAPSDLPIYCELHAMPAEDILHSVLFLYITC